MAIIQAGEQRDRTGYRYCGDCGSSREDKGSSAHCQSCDKGSGPAHAARDHFALTFRTGIAEPQAQRQGSPSTGRVGKEEPPPKPRPLEDRKQVVLEEDQEDEAKRAKSSDAAIAHYCQSLLSRPAPSESIDRIGQSVFVECVGDQSRVNQNENHTCRSRQSRFHRIIEETAARAYYQSDCGEKGHAFADVLFACDSGGGHRYASE